MQSQQENQKHKTNHKSKQANTRKHKKQTKKPATKNQQTKQKQNNQKNTKKWDRYQQWGFMHDDILCVMMIRAPNKKQNKEPQQKHQGPNGRVYEATKLNAETRDPPSQDPRDHNEQPSRHDIHPDTLKQTPTTPGRNESGEKLYKVKQMGETRASVKRQQKLWHSGHTQSPLSSSFPSISIMGAVVCGKYQCTSALASRLHGMGDYAHHQCVFLLPAPVAFRRVTT